MVVKACREMLQVKVRARELDLRLHVVRSRLAALAEEERAHREQEEQIKRGMLVTRGFTKERAQAGQEKQLELSRCVEARSEERSERSPALVP